MSAEREVTLKLGVKTQTTDAERALRGLGDAAKGVGVASARAGDALSGELRRLKDQAAAARLALDPDHLRERVALTLELEDAQRRLNRAVADERRRQEGPPAGEGLTSAGTLAQLVGGVVGGSVGRLASGLGSVLQGIGVAVRQAARQAPPAQPAPAAPATPAPASSRPAVPGPSSSAARPAPPTPRTSASSWPSPPSGWGSRRTTTRRSSRLTR